MSTMGTILHLVFLLPLLRLGATSSVGKEFALIYPEMKGYNGSVSLSTYVVGLGSKTVTVYESGNAGAPTLVMMNGEMSLSNSNIIFGIGTSSGMVRLTSDKNVNIFGRYTGDDRGELYQALPATSLGSDYYVVTYCEAPGQFCQIQIATLDIGTTATVVLANGGSSDVTVEFSGVTYYGGDTISIVLIQYQVVHLQSTSDLTGTRISANTNIVVYSGSSGTTIQGVGDGFLLKPMPPVSTWGREYVAVRTPGRNNTGDYFRIITCESNTIVTVSGESPIVLPNQGQWIQRNFSGSDVRMLSSNKPVMVVRLSPGQREATEPGLPTMVVMVPNEQFGTETGVVVPKVSELTNSTVTVVTEKKYISNMVVESSSVTNWARVGNSNYMVSDVPVTSAVDFITVSSVPQARFAVYFHSHGSFSLAYTGGRNFADINPPCAPTAMSIGDEVDNDCDGQHDEDSCTLTDYAGKDCSVIVSGERDVHGTQFVFVFPYHTPDPALTVAVYFSQPSVVVTLQTPNLPGLINITQTLSGTTRSLDVHYTLQVNESSTSNNTMLLEASEEVSLMILSADPSPDFSGGAFRALPTDGLGREYIAVTYCEDNMCFIDISAVHPDTTVTVRLKLVNVSHAITYGGAQYRHGDTIAFSLALYESAQVLSAVDMTGTKITASKPVAVITGGQFTKVMGPSNKDMVVEQLMPLQALGQSVAVVQTPGRLEFCGTCRDYIRIVATQDDTLVTLTMDGASTPYDFTFEGMFQDIQLQDKGTIKSDKPIMVIQFMVEHSIKIDGGMVLVVPVEQYSNGDYLFIPSTNVDAVNIMIITNQSDTSTVKYNDRDFTTWQNLPGTMMLATSSAELVKGQAYNINGSSNSTIGGHIATRMAKFAPGTFSFPLAFKLDAINQPCQLTQSVPGDNIDNDCDGLVDEENCTVGISEDGDYDGMFDEDCKEAAVASSSIMPTSAIAESSVDLSVTSLEEHSSQLVTLSTSEDIITSSFTNPSASSVDHLVTPISTQGIATSTLLSPPASSQEHSTLSTLLDPSVSSVDVILHVSSLGSSAGESSVFPVSSVDVSALASLSTFLPYASAQLETSSILTWSTETPESSHANIAVISSTVIISQSQQTIEERCTCKCSPWKTDIASESLTQVVESIKKELTVDKDTVSQAIRKKTSAPDHRQSAVSMGYVGIAVISSLFVGIFVLDAGSLYRDLLSLFKTLKDNCKSKQAK
ncbi:uncharacterized protein [Haliotis asinina]|uniref:uncharacterized protein n=1 Tax=Haliotis asinina TaxID=109174 RepID=UPI003531D13F